MSAHDLSKATPYRPANHCGRRPAAHGLRGERALPHKVSSTQGPHYTLKPDPASCKVSPSSIPAAGLPSPGAPGRRAPQAHSCHGPPWGPLTRGPPTTLASGGHSLPARPVTSFLHGKRDGLAATCVQATGHPVLSPTGALFLAS